MYCVMRASVPSLHNVYRRYDKGTDQSNRQKRQPIVIQATIVIHALKHSYFIEMCVAS